MKSKMWVYILLSILFLYLAILIYNRTNFTAAGTEGFRQAEPFVVRRDNDIYDDFYAEIYDRLMMPEKRVPFEIDAIVANTQASPKSAFLEIGSGTGYLVKSLKERGFDAYGIDRSQAMVDYSISKYPEVPVKCGTVADPITFEKNTFSHILCMYFTVYQFADKVAFFRNCYHWLLPNGCLVLHLVDPDQYDAVVPRGKPDTVFSMRDISPAKRITNTEIDFGDFYYTSGLTSSPDEPNTVTITEKFTDRRTHSVRQNEQTLTMEPVKKVLQIARYCGFIIQGKMDYKECNGDSHQYLYFLEKAL